MPSNMAGTVGKPPPTIAHVLHCLDYAGAKLLAADLARP